MKYYWFKQAYLDSGWASGVTIAVADNGLIESLEVDTLAGEFHSIDKAFDHPAIPGMPNIHSHAFQRAMAGLSEKISAASDTFWSWRKIMYAFAHQITPEDLRAIAAQLYMEMLKSGYTSVAEFHYLHHQASGQPYPNQAELALAIIEGAAEAQISLTILPVLYMSSDFGGAPLKDEQKLFGNTVEEYQQLHRAIGEHIKSAQPSGPTVSLGAAFHSLRAVPPKAMAETLAYLDSVDPSMPIHIHIAEQVAEVEASMAWSGQRPVEWLLNNVAVDSRWCLIHATHINEDEIAGIVKSGATVGLCPTTEANLGDGFFPLGEFMGAALNSQLKTPFSSPLKSPIEGQGSIAIGSDSNTSASPIEELRLLEYGQRLLHRGRNLSAVPGSPHTGTRLYDAALEGGAKATGRKVGKLAPGYSADILVLDSLSPDLFAKASDDVLNGLIFSGNTNKVRDVMAAGHWVVENFAHKNEAVITERYRNTLARLQGKPL